VVAIKPCDLGSVALGFGMDYYRGRWRVQEAWMTGSQLSARFRPILALVQPISYNQGKAVLAVV